MTARILALALLALAAPAAAEQATLRAGRPNMTPLTLRASTRKADD